MRKYFAILGFLAAAGCGYIGAPLPPALNIPQRVTAISASQHGPQLVIGFVITGETTDGLVLRRLKAIDLRVGPPAPSMDAWARGARQIPVDEPKIEGRELKTPIAGLENQDVVVAVRAIGPTGRAGAWSEPLRLHIVPAPAVPVVALMPGPDGVTLSWPRGNAPAVTKWRIYRQRKGEEQAAAIGEATESHWLDPVTDENAELTYQVQTLQPAGKGFAESERSRPVSLIYRDVFPPAAPAGLTAIAGVGTVELAWEPNHEPDLAGYQVYRAEAGGTPAKLGAVTVEVTFSDNQTGHGKHYVYAVAAVDKLGNQSKLSATAEAVAP